MKQYHVLVHDLHTNRIGEFRYQAEDDETAYAEALRWFGLATRTFTVKRQEGSMYELVQVFNP